MRLKNAAGHGRRKRENESENQSNEIYDARPGN